jgi:hypothetical protein
MTKPRGELEFIKFERAMENMRESLALLDENDARLALIVSLAELIVFGRDGEHVCEHCEALRLPLALQMLSNIVVDMMTDGPDDDEDPDEDSPPPSPSPDLLRKLLERRRAKQGSGHDH